MTATSRDDFAILLMQRLHRDGVRDLILFDDATFALSTEGDRGEVSLLLEQLYHKHSMAASEDEREFVLASGVIAWRDATNSGERGSAGRSLPRLIPVIRSRFDFDVTLLRGELQGGPFDGQIREQLAFQVFAEHLAVVLAEDHPQSLAFWTHAQFANCGTRFDEALQRSLKDVPALFGNSREIRFVQERGIWSVDTTGHAHLASALFAVEQISRLPLRGHPIALVPTPEMLFILGSDDGELLSYFAGQVLQDLESGRLGTKVITPIPLTLTSQGWMPWMPERRHSAFAVVKQAHIMHWNTLYSVQRKLLQAKFPDMYIASYTPIIEDARPAAQPSVVSVCVWTQNLPTLLPRTEVVALKTCLNDAELQSGASQTPEFGEQVDVAWQDLIRLAGSRLRPMGIYPERYLVEEFPEPPLLARLRAHAWHGT